MADSPKGKSSEVYRRQVEQVLATPDSWQNPPSSTPPTSTPTLAEVKRKARLDAEAAADDTPSKRFKILNYTSEDSVVTKTEKKLRTYYCSICGAHSLVSEADLAGLPKRKSDGSYVLKESATFTKRYMQDGERVLLKRGNGIEVQHRLKCQDCENPLAYQARTGTLKDYLYIFSDSLVSEQRKAAALAT